MATDSKPVCGCGHTFSEHFETQTLSGQNNIAPCVHIERTPGGRSIAAVCDCKNYKPKMTQEQLFKNCVVEAMVGHLPSRMLRPETLDTIADQAWRAYNQ